MNAANNIFGGRTPLLIFLAVMIAAGLWWYFREQPPPVMRPAPAVPVRVATVKREDVNHYAMAVGQVEARHRVTIRPQVDGQLMQVPVQEGQHVRKGDLLATIDDRAIRAALALAEAEKSRAEAQLVSARLELSRFVDLVRKQAITPQQLEQQETRVAELEATVRAMEASIAAENIQLSHTRITSPIDGRIGLRQLDPGNVVSSDDKEGLFTVTQSDRVSVIFSLSQLHLPALTALLETVDQTPVELFDRDAGRLLAQGYLVAVDPLVDSQTGSVSLRAVFDNPHHALWPGQLVTVRVRTGVSRDSLTLPSGAVRLGLEQPFVYCVREGKAEVVNVSRLREEGDLSLIEGLAPGDIIVIDGFSRLKNGVPVQIMGDSP